MKKKSIRITDAIIAMLAAGIFGVMIFFPVFVLIATISDAIQAPREHAVMPVAELAVAAVLTMLLAVACFRLMYNRLR